MGRELGYLKEAFVCAVFGLAGIEAFAGTLGLASCCFGVVSFLVGFVDLVAKGNAEVVAGKG